MASTTQSRMPDPDFDIGLSCLDTIQLDLEEVEQDLRSTGARVRREDRESEIYAGAEWLMETAVALFLVRTFFGAMIDEAGKDAYSALKRGMATLLDRTNAVRLERLSSSRSKLSEDPPGAFSVTFFFAPRQAVRLVFDPSLSPLDQERSLRALWRMLEELAGASPSTVAGLVESLGSMAIMRFDRASDSWRPWNVRTKDFQPSPLHVPDRGIHGA